MSETSTLPANVDQGAIDVAQSESQIVDAVETVLPSADERPDRPAITMEGSTNGKAKLVGEQESRGALDMIKHIPVTMEVVLGSTSMSVEKLVSLGQGAIIPLDRSVGEPVDVVVNGRLVARGEVVVTDDDAANFAIKITEIVGLHGSTNAS